MFADPMADSPRPGGSSEGRQHLYFEMDIGPNGKRRFSDARTCLAFEEAAREGSLVYEVSMTHWHFGRGKARFMSVDEAEAKRYERRSEGRKKAAETRKRKHQSSKE